MKRQEGVPIVTQQLKNPPSIYEDAGSIAVLTQWVKYLTLLQAVAQELPYAAPAAIKREDNVRKKFTFICRH